MDHKVVTRFAPSPTGFLHIGGVRTALFAFLFARKHEGEFILRIEDTDKSREVEGSIQHIIESLSWLNIEWDYGPDKEGPFGSCIQSNRLDIYRKYAEILIERDLAYPDPYSQDELNEFRKQAEAERRPFLYREHRPETFGEWDGSTALRLKVPELKRYEWQDAVRGKLSAGEEMLDDIILIKADGYPTYNFAHIVDDLEMGITHVMRGEEFISSTPKFLSIYDAMSVPYPVFVTMPPILRDDRTKKLGKRDGAKDILEYREEGFLPETMINFLALTGWNPGTDQEEFTLQELISEFTLEGIQKAGAVFNEEKLTWLNGKHLSKSSDELKFDYVRTAIPENVKKNKEYSDKKLRILVPTILERYRIKTEIREAFEVGEYDFAFTTPQYDTQLLKFKNDPTIIETKTRLEKVLDILTNTDFSSPEAIKEALWPYAEEVGRGEVLWPLRVALSGKERSPDPFLIAFLIGPEESIKRIKLACDKIG